MARLPRAAVTAWVSPAAQRRGTGGNPSDALGRLAGSHLTRPGRLHLLDHLLSRVRTTLRRRPEPAKWISGSGSPPEARAGPAHPFTAPPRPAPRRNIRWNTAKNTTGRTVEIASAAISTPMSVEPCSDGRRTDSGCRSGLGSTRSGHCLLYTSDAADDLTRVDLG